MILNEDMILSLLINTIDTTIIICICCIQLTNKIELTTLRNNAVMTKELHTRVVHELKCNVNNVSLIVIGTLVIKHKSVVRTSKLVVANLKSHIIILETLIHLIVINSSLEIFARFSYIIPTYL